LKVFFAGLERRGLLENSLIVIQGDHGPRIDKQGITSNSHHFDSGIFKVPFLIRAPGLSFDKQPSQPFVSLDIVPTVLDALGTDTRIIEQYVGHSVFRQRTGPAFVRNTFHAQIPGNSFVQVTRKEGDMNYKAIMLNKDICVTDTLRDPYEEFLYCAAEGWRKTQIDGRMEDGLSIGLWKAGEDEDNLKKWIAEAAILLSQHIARNKADWADSAGGNHTLHQQEVLQQLATYSLVH
jgi:arylsulfatase A-like enzyme